MEFPFRVKKVFWNLTLTTLPPAPLDLGFPDLRSCNCEVPGRSCISKGSANGHMCESGFRHIHMCECNSWVIGGFQGWQSPEQCLAHSRRSMDAQDWSTAALAPFRPRWTKQLFTDFISFTLKLVLKGQHCHPHVALPLFWSPSQPGEPPALSAPDLRRGLHHLHHHSQLSPDKGWTPAWGLGWHPTIKSTDISLHTNFHIKQGGGSEPCGKVLVRVQTRKKLLGMWMSENPGEDVPHNPQAAGYHLWAAVCRPARLVVAQPQDHWGSWTGDLKQKVLERHLTG
ncbi:uncharacterized protein LOC112401256 [Neophocaena asiaeorientalis asiaeorientalis]|uniref:Uncharacterized protein LOC112401256 n=1 Tax=Neophocaena asiaeorientalis asiaeorientalis TaxID=1706337 RepID=A0A341BKA5_NEOAA|nr:uncharacterized protein LOC112401256 [Neophocaena asiaeorientalis asiaeorientalis]